jgi:cell division protein FtsA
LPFDVAEEMKKRYGSVMPVYESRAEEISSLAEDGHGASYQDLCDIIRARIEEIVRLILLELPRSEYEALVPAGLVLTGGSSNLSGIDALGRDILKLPVRVGTPSNIEGITDSLRDPAYATSVGLLLWGAKNEGRRGWRSRGLTASLRRLMFRFKDLFR